MVLKFIGYVLCAIPVSVAAQSSGTSGRQLIQNVRVFDGAVVLQHRSVLIENGKIVEVYSHPVHLSNTEIIDGSGRTLLPGLFDAHVHIPDKAESAAHQALQLGVTTQLDMFSGGDRMKKIKQVEAEDRPELSDVRTAGVGATVPGGHPTQMGGPPIPTITSPDQAQEFVDARIAEGSDYIKIVHDDGSNWNWTDKRVPMLDNATMRALILAAHKRGKLVVVHALSEQQARDAIEAGADGLAHIFSGDTVGADFGHFAAAHHIFVIPTLSTIYLDCGKSQGPAIAADPKLGPYIAPEWRQSMESAKPNASKNHYCIGTDQVIHQLVKENVPLLVGTDAPVFGTTYGASVHGELALLVGDGMTPIQALAAATSVPAHIFQLSDRGWIKAGMRADLVLVEGDPTTNILDTRNIVAVWKRGVRVQR